MIDKQWQSRVASLLPDMLSSVTSGTLGPRVVVGCCGSLLFAPLSALFTHRSKQHTPDVHLTVSLDAISRGEKTELPYFHIMSAANETPIVKALRKKKTSIGAMSKP